MELAALIRTCRATIEKTCAFNKIVLSSRKDRIKINRAVQ